MLSHSEARCACGAGFQRRSHNHVFCSTRCRYHFHDSRNPSYVANNRRRCQRWASTHRAVTKQQPWLLGAPPCEPMLPAAGVSISVSPHPKWPVVLRNTRALHGMLTTLLNKPHLPNFPRWALVPLPTQFGWGALFDDPADAATLAGKRFESILFDRATVVTFGPITRIKTPVIRQRGKRLVRLDCLTPTVIRNSGRLSYTVPKSDNIKCSLLPMLQNRVGLEVDPETLCLELVTRDTAAVNVAVGGKYPDVGGFTGSLVLRANAVGHWALKVAESYGLGSKVAFGYGRVRVSEVSL